MKMENNVRANNYSPSQPHKITKCLHDYIFKMWTNEADCL